MIKLMVKLIIMDISKEITQPIIDSGKIERLDP